jgi:hypothetical protein
MVNITDNNGDDASAMQSASGVLNVTVYIDGVSTYVGTTLSGGWANQNGTRSGIQFADDSWKSSLSGGEEITLEMAMFSSGDAPLADGDILQWVNADSKFKPTQLPTAVSSIDDLSDVDTSTVAPTDGQALSWDNANSKWKPGTVAGGAVDSVNTFTGAVSLGIEDMNDFTLASAGNIPYNTWTSANTPAAGEWNINSSFFYLPKTDSNGADQSSNIRALDGTTSLTITQGGTDYVITNAEIAADQLDGGNVRALIGGSSGDISSIDSSITKSGGITISCPSFSVPLLPLADGDTLQWVDADSKFKPTQLTAAGTRTTLDIGEYADDAAAGTGGVASGALYYNTTSSSYVLKS